ncbi:hypothetical protein BOX15_Mlig016595g3 [Macrostomum lignano]|uniref:Tudor domain-containing protein n=2 Tax=Macrostomum lignano TaxID=282301 RepID=A0A267GSJ2_9PLAT|nr:hypothetical protein BOX15_Mlig016595g3 [Macrostomum lignano]
MAASDPSPNLFIVFRSADTVSEDDVRAFLESFDAPETLSVPRRKEGESRLCFATYESEAKATSVMNAIIDSGANLKGERPTVRYNNGQRDNRRRTVGGAGGGGGPSSVSSFGQRRDDARMGSQSSLSKSGFGGFGSGGDTAARSACRSSGAAASQFYANKDIDLARLVIKVETGNGVRHIECQPDCFNLMRQFMAPDEVDTGIRAFAISANGGGGQQAPIPIRAEQTAPVLTNGQRQHNNGGGLRTSSSPQQLMPPPPPLRQPQAPPQTVVPEAASTVPKPVARFEPRRLAPGERLRAQLIEFDSVNQFTAVDMKLGEKYQQQVEVLIDRLYNNANGLAVRESAIDAKVGDCVCAMWDSDSKYYRAVVREVSGGRLTVFFFDEASIDGVQAAKVRIIAPELISLPNLALLCRLDGVQDSEFNRLRNKLAAAGFIVDLEIVQCNGFECSVRMYLGGECLNNAPAAAAPASQAASSLPVRSVEPNREYPVVAIEAASPAELGLMLIEHETDYQAVAALLAQINANNGANLEPLPAIPPVGSACLARWAQDNNFYRARVIQLVGDNRCRLFFLDDGNTDMADLEQLKQLPAELTAKPPVALRCRAVNASDARLTKPIPTNCEMLAVFAAGGAGDAEVCFDASLVGLQFAADKSDALIVSVPAASSALPAAPAAAVPAFLASVNNIDQGDDSREVRIVHMDSPIDFLVQRTDMDAEFGQFAVELDAHCKQGASPCQPSDLQVNSLVAAPFMDVYYRARITQLLPDQSSAVVYYIDYGNADSVGFNQLFKLEPAHLAKPAWVKRGRLSRIAPAASNGQWPDNIQVDVQTQLGGDTAVLRFAPPDACDLATEQCPSLCQALVRAGLAAIVIE